jgi:hypothetical protein
VFTTIGFAAPYRDAVGCRQHCTLLVEQRQNWFDGPGWAFYSRATKGAQ